MSLLCIVGLGVGIEAMQYKQLDAPTVNRNTILTALEGIMAVALLCVFIALIRKRWRENGSILPLPTLAIFKKHWVGFFGLVVIVVLEVVKTQMDLEPRQQQDLGVAQMGLFVVVVALTLWQRRKSTSTITKLEKAQASSPSTTSGIATGKAGSDAKLGDT